MISTPQSVLQRDLYHIQVRGRIFRNRIEEWASSLHGPVPGLSRRVADEIESVD